MDDSYKKKYDIVADNSSQSSEIGCEPTTVQKCLLLSFAFVHVLLAYVTLPILHDTLIALTIEFFAVLAIMILWSMMPNSRFKWLSWWNKDVNHTGYHYKEGLLWGLVMAASIPALFCYYFSYYKLIHLENFTSLSPYLGKPEHHLYWFVATWGVFFGHWLFLFRKTSIFQYF